MFNMEDILARLHNGETVDDIASEMADALNEAIDVYNEEVDEQDTTLEEAAAAVGKAMRDYFIAAMPDRASEMPDDMFDGEIIREVLDQTIPLLEMTLAFANKTKNTNDGKLKYADPDRNIQKIKDKTRTATFTAKDCKINDPLMDFLSKNGLV